ncbi:murein hydrolase activator EnvC family protein [Corynebacterium otitidis]|uniref:murein hydrolase activator EnvC family protein n=2 Tax=Corynebacterium otitidis TaxID=29321 RepID=UPI0002ED1AB9|nr:M23 family metallopeptidase [Corynebacterium otitidis]
MVTRPARRRPGAAIAAALLAWLLLAAPGPPARAIEPPAPAPPVAYSDPVSGLRSASPVLRAFDPPERDWLPGHRGVDLEAAPGRPILAAGDGIVAFAGPVAGVGVVSIDHSDGLRTTYQPVVPAVAAGEQVSRGQRIGVLGGPVRGEPGLHWGLRPTADPVGYLNPLSLLEPPRIRLKPSAGLPAGRASAGRYG